jgi:hypothetical protein
VKDITTTYISDVVQLTGEPRKSILNHLLEPKDPAVLDRLESTLDEAIGNEVKENIRQEILLRKKEESEKRSKRNKKKPEDGDEDQGEETENDMEDQEETKSVSSKAPTTSSSVTKRKQESPVEANKKPKSSDVVKTIKYTQSSPEFKKLYDCFRDMIASVTDANEKDGPLFPSCYWSLSQWELFFAHLPRVSRFKELETLAKTVIGDATSIVSIDKNTIIDTDYCKFLLYLDSLIVSKRIQTVYMTDEEEKKPLPKAPVKMDPQVQSKSVPTKQIQTPASTQVKKPNLFTPTPAAKAIAASPPKSVLVAHKPVMKAPVKVTPDPAEEVDDNESTQQVDDTQEQDQGDGSTTQGQEQGDEQEQEQDQQFGDGEETQQQEGEDTQQVEEQPMEDF